MDDKTVQYYERHATDVAARYRDGTGGVSRYFGVAFPAHATVLDVGAGSGRDMAQLLGLGHDVQGIEPAPALIREAETHYPELRGRLTQGHLPEFDTGQQFDGVLCSAVLMHLPEEALFDAALALRDVVRPGGRLLVSIPLTLPHHDEQGRDADGRLFRGLEVDRLILLFERLGVSCLSRFEDEDSLGRAGRRWATLILERGTEDGRTLDRIEMVLNRDRKVATYKLALLKAICDLAAADDGVADWRHPGEVGVPLGRLAELWLFYYWPLVTGEPFLPQIQHEQPDGPRPIRFRRELAALADHYGAGGLDVFAADYQSGRLSPQARALTRAALDKIRQAIRTGPVKYAEAGGMFRYDKATRSVFMDAGLWQEFVLSGHWIRDALSLRWAEHMQRFDPALRKGDLLDRLLTEPTCQRDVKLARACFLSRGALRCVWSDRTVRPQVLEVDHALPFALWRNNDLWNLLPAHRAVNQQKRDRVPDAAFLKQRAPAIRECWDMLDDCQPVLFARQREEVLGKRLAESRQWPAHLLQFMQRACEFGIQVRGIPQWLPETNS